MGGKTETAQRWGSNTRRNDQQQGRDGILDAAMSCYLEQGVTGTTIDHIAGRAQISRRTVYRYFENKQAVLLAVVELQASEFFNELRKSVRRYRGHFPTLLKRSMLYTIEHGPRAPGHGLLMGKTDNIAMASQHYFASEAIKQNWESLLRESFEKALARGDIPVDTDFEQLAAWSRRIVMSYILFPAPRPSVMRDIETYVLNTLHP